MARDFTSTIRVIAGSPSPFPITAWPITVAVWVKGTDANTTAFAMADSGSDNDWILLGTGPGANKKIKFGVKTSGAEITLESTGTVTPSIWTHACGVIRSDTDREVYRDGSTDGTASSSKAFPNSLDRIGLGGIPSSTFIDAGGLFNGIAHAALWDTDLNASEIAALGSGVSPQFIRPGHLKIHVPAWGDTPSGEEPEIAVGDLWTLQNTGSTPTKSNHAPVGRSVMAPIPVVENFHFGETFNQRQVYLYDRQSGDLIQSTLTDVNGDYEFKQVDGSNNREHYVVVLDKD